MSENLAGTELTWKSSLQLSAELHAVGPAVPEGQLVKDTAALALNADVVLDVDVAGGFCEKELQKPVSVVGVVDATWVAFVSAGEVDSRTREVEPLEWAWSTATEETTTMKKLVS